MTRQNEIRLKFNDLDTLFSELMNYVDTLFRSETHDKFCIQVAYSTRTYPKNDMNYLILYEHYTADVRGGRIKMFDHTDNWNAFGFMEYGTDGNVERVTTISVDMLKHGIFMNKDMVDYCISIGAYRVGQSPYWLSFTLNENAAEEVAIEEECL